MSRGFVFTLEAVVALFFALALTAAVTGYLAGKKSPAEDLYRHQLAQDILAVMDKNKTLHSLLPSTGGEAAVQSFLNATLPPNAGARVNVTVYAYKNDECPSDYCKTTCQYCNSPTGFCACKSFSVSTSPPPASGVSVAQRFFTNRSINKFGIATIEVWWK